MITEAEKIRRLDEWAEKIRDFVLAIDREQHDVCQPLLTLLINASTELRDMRDKDMREADVVPAGMPQTARILIWPSVSRGVSH